MPSPQQRVLLTPRDLDILAALDRCPLAARQLLTLSQSFVLPFTDERRVRERLQLLCAAGRVRRWFYATAGRGALGYYTLSPLGYRLLHGEDAGPPARRAFGGVGIALQYHALRLADFIVHTTVAARREGFALTGFYRENTVCLSVGDDCIYPDCAFQLVSPTHAGFGFFVEIDNSTEVLRSARARESWERKLRLYDAFQDKTAQRFRVLILTTRSAVRAEHILGIARSIVRNPQRSLFYATSLDSYLACEKPLTGWCFRNHQGQRRSLVWHPRHAGITRNPCQDAPRVCYSPAPVATSVVPA